MFKRALVLSAGLLSLMSLPHDAEAFWYARGWRVPRSATPAASDSATRETAALETPRATK